ncbi:MAG: hypothetical protein ACLFUJ_06745 [Phycisphaerae bacterium]
MPDHDDHARALEAMAAGEDLDQPDPQEPSPQAQDGDEVGQAQAAEGETPDEDATPAALAGTLDDNSQAGLQKRARSARNTAAARKANAGQMKKIMIPPMLVSGVILIGLAVAMLILKPYNSGSVSPAMGKALTFAAFPLGAILIVGAWWLHHDDKNA